MTTIAWDGKTLAADTQINAEGIIVGFQNKIVKVGKVWVACAGTFSDCEAFEQWIKEGQPSEKPKIDEEFDGIMLSSKGLFEYSTNLFPSKVLYPAAWGCGWKLALIAMDFNCDAKEAVKYAATRDNNTGGRIQVVSLSVS